MTEKNDIYLGLFIFFLNFILALHQNWSATDLVWCLWISSLVLGYAYILTTILGILLRGDRDVFVSGGNKKNKMKAPAPVMNVFFLLALLFMTGFSRYTLYFFIFVIVSILLSLPKEFQERLGLGFLPDENAFISRFLINFPAALFMLGFFTFHFGMFHFVHSIFLNGFFPILPESPFGKTLDETGIYFMNIIEVAVSRFWPFILLSALSRLGLYTKAFQGGGMDGMFIPYKNVIRMHITIFVVAFLSMADIGNYALYFIFVIYFLPLGSIFRLLKVSRKGEKVPDFQSNKPIE
jgi:hypothetical protein